MKVAEGYEFLVGKRVSFGVYSIGAVPCLQALSSCDQ